MSKILLFHLLFCICFIAKSQAVYHSTNAAEIRFFSETLIEDISARNGAATSLLDIDKQAIAVVIPMAKFKFPNRRMEEHFQENYLETERFPYATFKGKINEEIDWHKQSRVKISATGTLTLHGVARTTTITGEISITPAQHLVLDTHFDIALADYGIEVPKLVWAKIAERIQVDAFLTYLPQPTPPTLSHK